MSTATLEWPARFLDEAATYNLQNHARITSELAGESVVPIPMPRTPEEAVAVARDAGEDAHLVLEQVAHYLTTFAAVLHDFGVHEEPTHTIHRLNADRVAYNDFYTHLMCMPIAGKADDEFADEVLRRSRNATRELIRTGERLTPAILPPHLAA